VVKVTLGMRSTDMPGEEALGEDTLGQEGLGLSAPVKEEAEFHWECSALAEFSWDAPQQGYMEIAEEYD